MRRETLARIHSIQLGVSANGVRSPQKRSTRTAAGKASSSASREANTAPAETWTAACTKNLAPARFALIVSSDANAIWPTACDTPPPGAYFATCDTRKEAARRRRIDRGSNNAAQEMAPPTKPTLMTANAVTATKGWGKPTSPRSQAPRRAMTM